MARKKKIVPIDYTSRDFDSIRNDLVSYVKRYYPNTYKDFNEATFGSIMLDTVSYVGDMLSFYLDYQANESVLETSMEYDNVMKHAKEMGYRFRGASMTHGDCSFYALIPALDGVVVPDRNYMPVLMRGTRIATDSGVTFTLNENIDFSDLSHEIVVARTDNDGAPTFYAVKASGAVVSGEIAMEEVEVGDFERFMKVSLENTSISEIISVFDTNGNEYFEVDYLSQNIVFREVKNSNNLNDGIPSVLKAEPVVRRFVVEREKDKTVLQFGFGSESELTNQTFADPSDIVLKVHGKNYVSDNSFDPKALTSNDKMGIAPSNTTLFVTYRVNSHENANLASNTLNNIEEPIVSFSSRASLRSDMMDFVTSNMECTNEEPITGFISTPTTQEIKIRARNSFASQNRAVTKMDYIASVYAMPEKFGAVKRCNIEQDRDELKRNLNLYVVSEAPSGTLVTTNATIKQNLSTWLNQVKMIGETIDILDATILNVGIEFEAIAEGNSNHSFILESAISEIIEEMTIIHKEIGEPLYVTDVFKVLKDVEGILDVVDVRITIKTGGDYSEASLDLNEYLSNDGRVLNVPNDHILEIKYPNIDIVGAIS